MRLDLHVDACATLASVKHTIAEAEQHVADVAGLYAIYGAPGIWRQLGLGDPPNARPLYVGKAEASLRARDLKQHFKSGNTGQSTVRRTFAALLRNAYGFRGVPRNVAKPDKPSHFGLEGEHDAKLMNWMNEQLELAVWKKPVEGADLHAVEVGVLGRLVPPVNIQDNGSSPWLKQVPAARRVMANDARQWAVDLGFLI